MKYLRLFEEFIQDPVYVDYEIKQMIESFENFIEIEGFRFEKPYVSKSLDYIRDFSINVSTKKNSTDNISKDEIDKLLPKLSKFFRNWITQFEKTNNLLTFTTDIENYFRKLELKINIVIKGIKYFKWRYRKGEGKKLFHFSDAKNREFISRNGISPTMNKRWTDMQKDLATGKPAVYAMPSFDINLPSTSPASAIELTETEAWQKTLNNLFKRDNYKTSVFSTISLIKEGEDFNDYVERSCTLVPSSKYSFKATDPNFKILTKWAVVVDDEIQKLIDNKLSQSSGKAKELKIDESKFIDTTGEFKFIDGEWSDLAGRQGLGDWNCYASNYMIDLWEIDLDKINHVWWLDPVVKLQYLTADERGDAKRDEKGNLVMRNFDKLHNWQKWLISYDGVIPPSAIKLKQSYQHQGKFQDL